MHVNHFIRHFRETLAQIQILLFIYFINIIKEVQTNTYIAISSINEIKNITNRTYLNKKARIEDFINKYKNKNISRLDFVKSVSNYYNKT